MRIKSSTENIEKSIVITCIASLLAVVLKTIQIIMFFNDKTGLIEKNLTSNILNIIVMFLIITVLIFNIKLSLNIVPLTKKFTVGTPRIMGFVFLATSLLFLVQGLLDLIKHLFPLKVNAQILETQGTNSLLQNILMLLPLMTDILCILSAFSFYILAIEYIKEGSKKHYIASLIPVVWGSLLIFNTLVSVSTVVSMQGSIEKVVMAMMMVLFLYVVATCVCQYEKKKKSLLFIFIQFSFSTTAIATIIPYSLAYIGGKKDSISNVPFLCYVGMILYGLIVIIQFYAGSNYIIKQKKKIKSDLQ